MIYSVNFQTSYGQFYLFDKGIEGKTDSPTFWSNIALDSGIALAKGVIGIGIASYGLVRLGIEIFKNEPPILNLKNWDRVTEGSIHIKTGYLEILDCPNSEVQLEIPLEKGDYRIRLYGGNFNTVEGDYGDDFYRIEIWAAPYSKRKSFLKYTPQ